MKKTVLLLFSLITVAQLAAQKTDYKFGKISQEELDMPLYDKDTSAHALILYEDVEIYYDFAGDKIKILYEYSTRIKVFTPEGTSRADVSISVYEAGSAKEQLSKIDAAAYNYENGKLVKTALKRQYIFQEKVNDRLTLWKFSIPEVKAGTVIEYKYTKSSDFIGDIPDINIQHDIPVLSSRAQVSIPEWFHFSLSSKGFLPIENQVSGDNAIAFIGGNSLGYTVKKHLFRVNDVPALKEEPMVWNLDDFRSKIEFEISSFVIPGVIHKTFTANWAAVNEQLSNSDFGRWLKMSNPLKDETGQIRNANPDPHACMRGILKMIQSKVKWNEQYRLVGNNPRNALKEGAGSTAQINFLLISALRDAGFDASPVMLNPRRYGRLPVSRPTLDKINSIVAVVTLPDGSRIYMDASDPDSDLNVLPPQVCVDQARIFGIAGENGRVNLSMLAPNLTKVASVGTLNAEGELSVEEVAFYTNQSAYAFKKRYQKTQTKEKYIEELDKEDNLTVSELNIKGLDSCYVERHISYTMPLTETGDICLLNATIKPFMSKNPLQEQTRKLPIEFNTANQYDISCSIEIPENFEVESLPENISMIVCDNGIQYSYRAQVAGNRLSIRVVFKQNRLVFTPDEYTDLHTFYGMVTDRSNSQIVLKRKN